MLTKTVMQRKPKNSSGQNSMKKDLLFVLYQTVVFVLVILVIYNRFKEEPISRNKGVLYGINSISSPASLRNIKRNSKTFDLPSRIKQLINDNEIVSENLDRVQPGVERETTKRKKTDRKELEENITKEPFSIAEIIDTVNDFINELSARIRAHDGKWMAEEVWEIYRNLTFHTIYPWDQEYLKRMPQRRNDDTLFLSIAAYRDENCISTISNAFGKADEPDKIFVGLLQQNCVENCNHDKNTESEADPDCYQLFCDSAEGKPYCEAGHVRSIFMDESESLGPYAARFFASKLWFGEEWFLQLDAHMTFIQGWDVLCKDMLKYAPTPKPVVSHYPPPHNGQWYDKPERPGARLCGPVFSNDDGEGQIIRLLGEDYFDKKKQKEPRFAPFVGAGFFLAHSGFLKEVPFDPFLPWIFMGEEIILSARLWTSGYDIYSPTQAVIGHMYGRLNRPKFWNTLTRLFKNGKMFTDLGLLVLGRIKMQLGYPECARDILMPQSLFTAVDNYTIGTQRPLNDYLVYCGLNFTTKQVLDNDWCMLGEVPKGFEQYDHIYLKNDEDSE